MKVVSIIILSYNTSKLLHDCLKSVEKSLKDYPYEIIVVDNLSGDDSVEMVKKNFKNVKLIENTENAGFAKGCNLGAKHAKGDFLLFLNSDTEMTENPLIKMESDFDIEKAGIVGGALQNFDGTPQRSFGPFYGLKEVAVMLFGGEKVELRLNEFSLSNKPHPQPHSFEEREENGRKVILVDWVSGGFMMVKKEIFDAVKGFDERFFMYIEDMELCYRVRKKGLLVLHDPQAVVKHLGQGSSNKGFAIINIFKGLKIFYKKHRNTVSYTLLVILLRLKAYIAIILGTIQNNSKLVETYRKTLV